MRANNTSPSQAAATPIDATRTERRGRRLRLNCRLFFFGEGDFEGEATVLDISTNGCRATSLTNVTVGLSLKLSLFLQDQQWPVRIDEAVVRWVDNQLFGLEFIGIRPAQRERLRAIVMKASA